MSALRKPKPEKLVHVSPSRSRNVPDDCIHVASVLSQFLADCFDDPTVSVLKQGREIKLIRENRVFTITVTEHV